MVNFRALWLHFEAEQQREATNEAASEATTQSPTTACPTYRNNCSAPLELND
jgi:hypothetical protein